MTVNLRNFEPTGFRRIKLDIRFLQGVALNTTSVNDEMKFLDDFTISETLPKFASSQIQDSQDRNKLDNWEGGGGRGGG